MDPHLCPNLSWCLHHLRVEGFFFGGAAARAPCSSTLSWAVSSPEPDWCGTLLASRKFAITPLICAVKGLREGESARAVLEQHRHLQLCVVDQAQRGVQVAECDSFFAWSPPLLNPSQAFLGWHIQDTPGRQGKYEAGAGVRSWLSSAASSSLQVGVRGLSSPCGVRASLTSSRAAAAVVGAAVVAVAVTTVKPVVPAVAALASGGHSVLHSVSLTV
ncbi:hypothetical protein OEZ86_006981 [Tetradesmus obliquus]|nr:hypothetical protein OEZ86_006981 [Tetradesmus obliquus]